MSCSAVLTSGFSSALASFASLANSATLASASASLASAPRAPAGLVPGSRGGLTAASVCKKRPGQHHKDSNDHQRHAFFSGTWKVQEREGTEPKLKAMA